MPYAKKLKVISIELAPGLLFRSKEFLWELTRNASPGFLYDENNLKDNVKSIAKIATEREYPQDLLNLNYLENTFLLPSLSWEKAETPVDVSTMPFDDANLQNNLKELIALKSLAEKNGIEFFMTITPRNKDYKKIDSYGYFGPSWNVATEIIEKIKSLGIQVFDENNFGDHDYDDNMASGPFHLSYLGAYQFTRRLDSFLKKLEIPAKTTTNSYLFQVP